MNKKLLAIALAFMAYQPPLYSQNETRSPTEAYRGDTAGGMKLCELKFQLSSIRRKNGEAEQEEDDPLRCIRDLQRSGATAYEKAAKTIKKKSAIERLKSYHAIWASAVKGIIPYQDEIVFSYNRRRAEAWDKLDEAWERFELENK